MGFSRTKTEKRSTHVFMVVRPDATDPEQFTKLGEIVTGDAREPYTAFFGGKKRGKAKYFIPDHGIALDLYDIDLIREEIGKG